VDFLVSSKSKEIKDKDKIFDSFYREEKSREGFGIGLDLVKNICDEESVSILLDSSDARTTFRYRFKMMGE
jgi:signal transduction histidine kinase